ncbi:hypothetical protein [Elioraea sp.]|uniref:hypothetical protein n=1 Tax=Elioraea sp. TaxID=2185103 RepID=UPI0025BA8DC7|nr:hypothetical protein [Elioraea sp.]
MSRAEGATHAAAQALAVSLDRASYAGYVAGFTAARDAAAKLARRDGDDALGKAIAALAPLPDRRRNEPGIG